MTIPDTSDIRELLSEFAEAANRISPLSKKLDVGITRVQAFEILSTDDPAQTRAALVAQIHQCDNLADLLSVLGQNPDDLPETGFSPRGRDIPTGRAASNTSTTPGVHISVGRAAKQGNRVFRPTELEATGGY